MRDIRVGCRRVSNAICRGGAETALLAHILSLDPHLPLTWRLQGQVRRLQSPRPMIRVLVADDHAMFREMLRIALPRSGDIEVVGEADNGQDLSEVVYRCDPAVLLLDYKMPHVRDFATLIRDVRQRNPALQVVVLSGFASSEIAARAADAGACGYVLKSTRLSAVGDAIRSAARGGSWIDPNLPRDVFEAFQRHATPPDTSGGLAGLTRREWEVLACVAEGIGNRDIARKLCISDKTVKTHLTRIFAKLNVKNRVGATVLFYAAGNKPRPAGYAGAGALNLPPSLVNS